MSYEIRQFQDIPFPDGAAVYEIRDGVIVNSYFHGSKPLGQEPSAIGGMSYTQLLLLLNGAAILIVLCLIYWRRKKLTQSSQR